MHAEALQPDQEQVEADRGGDHERELQQAIESRRGAPRLNDVEQQCAERANGTGDTDDA
jgi:hypothetical protein